MKNTYYSGFTMVETVIVMGLMGMLLALTSTTLFQSQQRASLTTGADGVVRDLREQQTKAMIGATNPTGTFVNYSVRFETDRYILFPGSSYSSADSRNIIVSLEGPLEFTPITFSNSILTFERISGEVVNYNGLANSVVLSNTQTGDQKTISVNQQGVVFVQ